MERLGIRERLFAGCRVVIRATEWLLWDVWFWIYRRGTGANERDDDTTVAVHEPTPCYSKLCRYCYSLEKTLLWEDFTFFVNFYLMIVLNATFWIYNIMWTPTSHVPFKILNIYFLIEMIIAFKFLDTLAPAAEHQIQCSSLHCIWKSLYKLRSKKPGLHCIILCLVAFGLWLLDHLNPSTHHSLYWGIVLGFLILRLPVKLSDKATQYLMIHREYDSEIEDEFLPVVTEANLQVLHLVGETGDQSPTPSIRSDTQNDSFYDEDFIEGLQEIAFNIPYHGEGSTDGVELSELELSADENDANENGIKFQAGHFEKSSSSSSEEEAFDPKKVFAVSSDDSNGDSDFEIIDKEEIAKMEM